MTERKMMWSPHSYKYDVNNGIFKANEPGKSQYEELEEKDYNGGDGFMMPPLNKILDTPFGNFILDDDLNPYKEFEFWVGHTNFDITGSIEDIINTTPGVEALQLISRYRFVIGIGKLFAFADVRALLQQKLCGTSVDVKNILARVDSLKSDFETAEYPDWAIYVFPNGEIDFCYLEPSQKNLEEFKQKKDLLVNSQALSHGKLFIHESPRTTLIKEE